MQQRFDDNLQRVQNIIQFYDTNTGRSQGRPTVQEGDLLRLAVVYLHATLEELFRDLAEQRLVHASADVLRQIPWSRGRGSTKGTFDLGDLADRRGQTVEDVIHWAIDSYLSKSNFNNPGDLKQLLDWVGFSASRAMVIKHDAEIASLMMRRHWIVHRADTNDVTGRGQHTVRSISRQSVSSWMKTIEKIGKVVLQEIAKK